MPGEDSGSDSSSDDEEVHVSQAKNVPVKVTSDAIHQPTVGLDHLAPSFAKPDPKLLQASKKPEPVTFKEDKLADKIPENRPKQE